MQPTNRKFHVLVGVVVLAAVAVGLWQALSGGSRLAELKRQLRAKGEKLTYAELVGRPVSDAPGPPLAFTNTNLIWDTNIHGLMETTGWAYQSNGLVIAVWQWATPAPPWIRRDGQGMATNSTMPQSWEALRVRLAEHSLTLATVRSIASVKQERPLVIPNYRARPPHRNEDRLPYWVTSLLGAAITLHLREGRLTEAFADYQTMRDLTRSHMPEGSLTDFGARSGGEEVLLRTTWAMLQATGWGDESLARLQKDWMEAPLFADFIKALEWERARGQRAFEICDKRSAEAGLWEALQDHNDVMGTRFYMPEPIFVALWARFFRGRDETTCLRTMQEQLELARLTERDKQGASALVAADGILARMKSKGLVQMLFVSDHTAYRCERAFSPALRRAVLREMAICAVALERHRLKHGSYPADLNQLVPAFLPSVPPDWMDGKPLRYQLEPYGRYKLWSVGLDGMDDGGDAQFAPMVEVWDYSYGKGSFKRSKDAVWPQALPVPKLAP